MDHVTLTVKDIVTLSKFAYHNSNSCMLAITGTSGEHYILTTSKPIDVGSTLTAKVKKIADYKGQQQIWLHYAKVVA